MSDENRKFSDLKSAYNKFTLVASISVFVSVLDLADQASFFGTDFSNLNERWVELSLIVATTVLGLNYLLTVFDTYREIKNLDEIFAVQLEKLDKNIEEMKRFLLRLEKLCEGYYVDMKRLRNIADEKKDIVENYEAARRIIINADSSWTGTPEEEEEVSFVFSARNRWLNGFITKNFLATFSDRFNAFEQSSDRAVSTGKELNSNLSSLNKTLKNAGLDGLKYKALTRPVRIRFWFIEVFVPLTLFLIALFSFVFPDKVLD